MDGVRGLGEDEHVRAHGFQKIEMRAQSLHLRIGIALQKFGGIPAGDAGQAEGCQRLLQGLRLARKLVAELHALEAGFLGLGQANLQRRLTAELQHVVVGPADGIGPDADRHDCYPFSIIFLNLILRRAFRPVSKEDPVLSEVSFETPLRGSSG